MKCIPAASRSRAGVTLIELLVVCTIIAILSAMAFPALTGAVARSRLTACTNNLNQLGFAILRHDEQFERLPGWRNKITISSGTIDGSWAVPLLQFIDRNDVYEDILATGSLWKVNVNTFICPSNSVSRTGTSVGILHYAANVGGNGSNQLDGVFLNYSSLALENVASGDGTASTLAFTEKSGIGIQDFHTWTWPLLSLSPYSTQAYTTLFSTGSTTDFLNFPPVFGVNGAPPGGNSLVMNVSGYRNFAPSSSHAGGVAVVFCDGHTGFLSDKMPYYIYAQLLTPKTRWSGTTAIDSSIQPWLLKPGNVPYVLDAKDLRQF